MVLEKEPKVQSTAIREMREEVRKRMKVLPRQHGLAKGQPEFVKQNVVYVEQKLVSLKEL